MNDPKGSQGFIRTPKGTVWKFQDFSITQILREISLRNSESSKTPIYAILDALKFDFSQIWPFFKVEIDLKPKFNPSEIAKW